MKNGILIHKIDKSNNKKLYNKQKKAPIRIEEFCSNNYTNLDVTTQKANLNGLTKDLSTISFYQTLNPKYQSILKQDSCLIKYLNEIHSERNNQHLYLGSNSAFCVKEYIERWKFIKETATLTIKNELIKIYEELKRL